MAHFAKIDENNIVQHIHVVDNEHLLNKDGQEEESIGIEYLKKIHGDEFTWVQTSYNELADENGNFRKNYGGVGFTYDAAKDAFIEPKPFASWILDEDTCVWNAPETYPDDGKIYDWNEDTQAWVIQE